MSHIEPYIEDELDKLDELDELGKLDKLDKLDELETLLWSSPTALGLMWLEISYCIRFIVTWVILLY